MQQIFIELSKYIFAFLIAFYTLASYQGAVMQNEQKRRKIYFTQNVLMFIIHLLGYLILYILNDEDMKYIMLYFVQFIYLFVVVMIYDVLYPKASRLLVNNMCMLMAIGFVMIARLDFDKCIKQFAIVLLLVPTVRYVISSNVICCLVYPSVLMLARLCAVVFKAVCALCRPETPIYRLPIPFAIVSPFLPSSAYP